MLSLLTLLEFYQHLQTFFVIFSSYRFQMKQISTLQIRCITTSEETSNFTSWAKLWPKMYLGFEIQKTNVKNPHPRDTVCANFQRKQTTLTFSVQICPKMGFWLKIQKTNVEIRISILEIPCVPIFRLNFDFFGPNLPKNKFWIGNSEN